MRVHQGSRLGKYRKLAQRVELFPEKVNGHPFFRLFISRESERTPIFHGKVNGRPFSTIILTKNRSRRVCIVELLLGERLGFAPQVVAPSRVVRRGRGEASAMFPSDLNKRIRRRATLVSAPVNKRRHRSRLRFGVRSIVELLEGRVLLNAQVVPASASTYLPPEVSLIQPGSLLSGPTQGVPLDVAKDYLLANASTLGLSPRDITQALVTDQYTDTATDVTHIYLRQTYNGLEIANTSLVINLTADNRVINVGGATARGLDQVPNGVIPTAPFISAADALRNAAPTLGLPPSADAIVASGSTGLDRSTTLLDGDLSLDPIPARLDYVASANSLDLAWGLILRTPDGDHWYDAQVDASEGTILGVDDWVDHASYDVFAPPVENPDMGSRTIQTNPADTTASPYGWHDTNGVPGAEYTTTQGNNVFAQEDTDANDAGGFRPDGGGGLNFNFPLDLTQDPSTYQSAAITQLFYTNNIMHDIFYHYGFDEVSGNFQVNNYGHGGLGGDAVQADGRTARILAGVIRTTPTSTPPRMAPPRMQMYVWDWTLPLRDGDLDNGIIIHEYGHGISNRLTGGPSNSNALHARQSGGMGEGWSDFFALMLTQLSTDTQNQAYPLGTYALGQPPSGGGFRREPYSFDMSIDSLTLAPITPAKRCTTRARRASTLWDLNWLLIQRHGFNPNLYAGYTGSGTRRKHPGIAADHGRNEAAARQSPVHRCAGCHPPSGI